MGFNVGFNVRFRVEFNVGYNVWLEEVLAMVVGQVLTVRFMVLLMHLRSPTPYRTMTQNCSPRPCLVSPQLAAHFLPTTH